MLKTLIKKVGQNKYLPILSILFLALIWLVYRLTIALNQTPELMNGETNNIWNALKVISGKPIYSNPEAIPYEIFQYTPLSQIPIILLAWIENKLFHTEDFVFTLTAGRLLSIIYNLITAYLIYRILKNHLKTQTNLAILGSLIYICFLPHHFFAIRPDSLALLFTVSGLYFFTKAYFLQRNKSLVFSAIILAFSFFVKQDAFLISGAFGLILLFTKNFKGLFLFSLTLLCSLGILLLVAPLIFGPFFYKSIFGGVALSMKFEQFTYILTRYITFYYLLILLIGVSIFFIIKSKTNKETKYFLLTSIIFSLFISSFTTLKEGSHINYYALPTLFGTLIIIYSFNQKYLKENEKNKLVFYLFTPFLCLHFIFFQFFHYTSVNTKFNLSKTEHELFLSENKMRINEIYQSELKVISFDQSAKLLIPDFILFPNSEFYGVSKFSYTSFNNKNPNQKVEFIILPSDMTIPVDYLKQFNINYKDYSPWFKSNQIHIYRNEH
jgi:hypothetical protein